MRLQADAQRIDQLARAITRAAFVTEPEPEGDGGLLCKVHSRYCNVPASEVDGSVDLVGRHSDFRLKSGFVAITKTGIEAWKPESVLSANRNSELSFGEW